MHLDRLGGGVQISGLGAFCPTHLGIQGHGRFVSPLSPPGDGCLFLYLLIRVETENSEVKRDLGPPTCPFLVSLFFLKGQELRPTPLLSSHPQVGFLPLATSATSEMTHCCQAYPSSDLICGEGYLSALVSRILGLADPQVKS